MRRLSALLLLVGLLVPTSAAAVEFRLDGFYRWRGEAYNTLSLTRSDDVVAEELREVHRHFMSNRLRVIPHLRINSNVHVFTDLDLLDALKFGSNPEILEAFGQTQQDGSNFAEPVGLSQSVIPGSDYKESLFVRRAWAELYTPYVDVKVGRMGNHWGMGLLANDGNCAFTCDYGDTVDRIQIGTSAIDPVRIAFAVDTRAEGFINRDDDTHSFLLSGGYLGEVHNLGGYIRWTRQPSNNWNLGHFDIWGKTKLGPLAVELEALLLYGKASTTDIGVEDLTVLAAGGALDAELAISPWAVGLEVGLATGDKDPTDSTWKAFTFDRDHDVGLLMFEQPMPQFQLPDTAAEETRAAAGNIDASQVRTTNAVSNAFYLRPRFQFDILDTLNADVAALLAFPVVPAAFDNEAKFYGAEIMAGMTWTLYGNFEVGGRASFLIPGPVYDPYKAFTFGGELRALVRF